MDCQHDGTDDQEAIGDIEVRPGVLAVSAKDPIANAAGIRAWQAVEVQSVVEVTEDTAGDET